MMIMSITDKLEIYGIVLMKYQSSNIYAVNYLQVIRKKKQFVSFVAVVDFQTIFQKVRLSRRFYHVTRDRESRMSV